MQYESAILHLKTIKINPPYWVEIAGSINHHGVVGGHHLRLQQSEGGLHDSGVVPTQTDHVGQRDPTLSQCRDNILHLRKSQMF